MLSQVQQPRTWSIIPPYPSFLTALYKTTPLLARATSTGSRTRPTQITQVSLPCSTRPPRPQQQAIFTSPTARPCSTSAIIRAHRRPTFLEIRDRLRRRLTSVYMNFKPLRLAQPPAQSGSWMRQEQPAILALHGSARFKIYRMR